MFSKPSQLVFTLLLLSHYILNAFATYPLGIQKDATQGLGNTAIYSSVVVYADDVDTTTFTDPELYGLAQGAYAEMQNLFVVNKVGGRKRPFTMAAMAIGNLVYFSSSHKSTNYVENLPANDVMSLALQKCQSGLALTAAQAGAAAPQTTHRSHASCGEVGCLLYHNRDTAPMIAGFNPNNKKIVAYGGNIQMLCCGDPALPTASTDDPTSWGCYEFMNSEGVTRTPKTELPLQFPAAIPVAIRHVNVC